MAKGQYSPAMFKHSSTDLVLSSRAPTLKTFVVLTSLRTVAQSANTLSLAMVQSL